MPVNDIMQELMVKRTNMKEALCDFALAMGAKFDQVAMLERDVSTEGSIAYEYSIQKRKPHIWASEWKDISSAPRDGTDILVWKNMATVPVVHIAWYNSAKKWEESGQYSCDGESLEDWEGWWSYTNTSVTQTKLDGWLAPTHWMPLPPKPPTDTNQE